MKVVLLVRNFPTFLPSIVKSLSITILLPSATSSAPRAPNTIVPLSAWGRPSRGGFDVPNSKTDAPDENKETTTGLARLGRSFSREVFPGIIPDSSMAIFSRSSDPLRVNLWSAFTIDATLFFQPPSYNSWVDDDFRTCIMAILELAENHLSCEKVVVCLHKDSSEVADFVKALMYVGFELCHPKVFNQSSDYLLVGYEV